MDDVTSLSDSDLYRHGRAMHAKRMKWHGPLKKNPNCQVLFVEHRDARFSSARCRRAAYRASEMEIV